MSSPEQHEPPIQENARYLPELKHHKHKNYSPVYSFINGVLAMEAVSVQDALAITQDVTNHFSDYLEGKRIRVIERIFHDIEDQLEKVAHVSVAHEKVVKPKNKHEDEDVKSLYDTDSSKKRILLEDDGEWILMVGYTLSEQGKIRPLLLDPHNPTKVDEKRNSWFTDVLHQGYWIITYTPSLKEPDSHGTN